MYPVSAHHWLGISHSIDNGANMMNACKFTGILYNSNIKLALFIFIKCIARMIHIFVLKGFEVSMMQVQGLWSLLLL